MSVRGPRLEQLQSAELVLQQGIFGAVLEGLDDGEE